MRPMIALTSYVLLFDGPSASVRLAVQSDCGSMPEVLVVLQEVDAIFEWP